MPNSLCACLRLRTGKDRSTKLSRISSHASLFALLATSVFLVACGGKAFDPPSIEGSVSGTNNPLVAQYTLASGCQGQAMVEFGPDTTYGRSTAWYPLAGQFQPITIFVAGMQAATTYHMRAQINCFGNVVAGADTTYTTGPLPASPPFPALQVTRPNPAAESPGIELVDTIGYTPYQMKAFFTDRAANPIWYYDVGQDNYPFTFKIMPNGHVIFSIERTSGDSIIREVDLAGNTIRELDSLTLGQEVQASFGFDPTTFHHDLWPLANGHLIVLMNSTQNFTDLPGYPGTTAVLGDQLVDLDENWNPVWAWNSFNYLDVNRHLNGLPDWTHSNAVVYSPDDGNLVLSMRHQSWILKIDYNNGSGSGNVLWRLGYQGDFALTQGGVPTDDPSEWFSFQHFPSLVSQSGPQTTLAIWDNGDNRVIDSSGDICGNPGAPACYSRATIFQVDESAMVANLMWDDLPNLYSEWGGSINQLENGDVEFDVNAPLVPPGPNVASEVQEVTQTASPQIIWKMDVPTPLNAYRAYRIPSLYPGVSWQY